MTEVWSPIPIGSNSYYEISTYGRVRSLASGSWRLRRLKPNKRTGYLEVVLMEYPGRRRTFLVHRLVALTFRGPSDRAVRHLDGDQRNNRLDNLAYGTAAENAADSIIHGTHAQLAKTQCPRGHHYTPENTYSAPGKKERRCRECARSREIGRTRAHRSSTDWEGHEL